MGIRIQLGLALISLLVAPSVSRAQESIAEIEAFLETYSATWNAHDGTALSALFTTDADLLMGGLARVDGRVAIGNWWNTYFSRIDEGRKGKFEMVSLRSIANGVRLLNIKSSTYGAAKHGAQLETRLARGTWILVKGADSWLIAAMRGFPAEGEDRSRPGTDL